MTTNPPEGPVKKPNLGRRKIEIKKIENLSNRQVTFSKRRTGLFKKATQLSILTGAEIAIIVQSAGKRIYSCGLPDVETITGRFNGENNEDDNGSEVVQKNIPAEDHNKVLYLQMCRELEALKKQNQLIKTAGPRWWDHDVRGLNLEDLENYAEALDEMMRRVVLRAEGLPERSSNSILIPKEEVLPLEDVKPLGVDQVQMIPRVDYGNCSILPPGFVYDPRA